MDRMVKARTGRGLFERFLSGIKGQSISSMVQEKMDEQLPPEVKLFKTFCERAEMKGYDAFKLACREMGFGFSDVNIGNHYEKFLKTGELPNYVESFLEKGKDYLL
jgi:hypothetical protein